jgi:DNA modification methylase
MEYLEFIENKKKVIKESGISINELNLNPLLKDFQKFIVTKALNNGKFAIFADCGLGKTFMQLEWAYQVSKYTNKPVLIICPLAVAGQTIQEGLKFGYKVKKALNNEIQEGLYIVNYEQLENLDCSLFSGVVLDESSILKNFTGKYKELIINLFSNTLYKLACTATPAPNDPMELGNHSEFLNQMSRNEMLSMYFIHDGSDTSKWRLKKHALKDFYNYISNFSVMISKPSDIGFKDDGYILPSLNINEVKIETNKKDNGLLFNDLSINATEFNQELRRTMNERLEQVAKIVNNSNENFIIWIKQNEEGELLKKLIPNSIEVKGSDSQDYKENKLIGFANNEFRVLITKTKIAQFGLNFQNCSNQIFASLDFSFEGLYQAIRRSYRFGQTQEVNITLITTDTMSNVIESIKTKENQFKLMQDSMNNFINKGKKEGLKMNNNKVNQIKSDRFSIFNNDCIQGIKELHDQSIDFSIFSPPFAELYTYSDSIADMGNSKDYKEFAIHFEYLVKELSRVIKDGRNVAVHCMDLPIQKGKEGFIGLRDFSGILIDLFTKNGFIYHDRITIWKDPVVEMQRTKALGLLHKQLKKDSTMSRTGIPDYLLVFRKEGENKEPIANKDISVDYWQKIASPVWFDINYTDTLQFRTARDEKDEKHICPLQLQTIERSILLWSNPNDTILSPFMGIGSEGYQALKMNRKFIGFELKESYFNLACRNMDRAINENKQLTLLDLIA